MTRPEVYDSPSIDVTATQRQIGALETSTIAQFQTIRDLAGSADASFTFGTRASRPASGAQGDRFFATDRNCLFYYNGTQWAVVVGFFSGSNATRAAMTVDATDNGYFYFANDQNKLWVVSGGAWVDLFTSLDATTQYEVGGAKVVSARKTGWSVATGTATRTSFDTATVTLPELAERVKALIDDLHATAGHGLIGT